jgi:protein TonB
MFQVLAPRPAAPLAASTGILPLAALLHVAAFSGVVAAQYWRVEPVPLPVAVERFVQVILPDLTPRGPQAEPPPPRAAAGAPAEARQPQAPPPTAAPPVAAAVQLQTLPPTVPGPAEGPEIDGDSVIPLGPFGPATGGGGGDCLVDCDPVPSEGSEGEGPVHVVAGISPPRILERVLPVYPEMARRIRLSGRVTIAAVIDRDGRVREAQVTSPPLGFGLEESALAAVQRWRYSPALRGSEPVAVYFRLTVDFGLR